MEDELRPKINENSVHSSISRNKAADGFDRPFDEGQHVEEILGKKDTHLEVNSRKPPADAVLLSSIDPGITLDRSSIRRERLFFPDSDSDASAPERQNKRKRYNNYEDSRSAIPGQSEVKQEIFPDPLKPYGEHGFLRRFHKRRHSFCSIKEYHSPFEDAERREPEKILRSRIQDWAPNKVNVSSGLTSNGFKMNKKFAVLYEISCARSHQSKYHNILLYEDDPVEACRGYSYSRHIHGERPVPSLPKFVRERRDLSFVVFRTRRCNFDTDQRLDWDSSHDESLLITSMILGKVLHSVATCIIDQVDNAQGNIHMRAPYRFIEHHRSPLEMTAYQTDQSTRDQMMCLLEYVRDRYGAEYDEARKIIAEGKITFRHLDKLYIPNEVAFRLNHPSKYSLPIDAMVVHSWPSISSKSIEYKLWNWSFDGHTCEKLETFHEVDIESKLDDLFPITDLDYVPERFVDPAIVHKIRERGRKFWDLREKTYVAYTGRGLETGDYKANRFMLDYLMYRRFHPKTNPLQNHWEEHVGKKAFWPKRLKLESELLEKDYLIMPASISGFDLVEKEWVDLLVDNIHPIQWNKQVFEQLVLPERTKELVRAMVMVRANSITKRGDQLGSTLNADVISGKGNGLTMLFHGSPGTGKTLTAGSVAEIAEMPLYTITCGDVGTAPEDVEKYLRTVFYIGKNWNCVLLLDEADVFLEERTLSDLQRNSLVSIFLRMIEYYDGILILTSNRVGTFDEAFRSRIQIALHYPDFNSGSRRQIWRNLLSRYEDVLGASNAQEIERHMDQLSTYNLNGREIRNALSTAHQLALYQTQTMSWKHLEHAIKTINDFGSYLENFHGHSDRQWAREAKLR